MKIAITGHLHGIGKAICEVMSDHDIIGFDLLDHIDISFEQDRNSIFEQSKDCDVFINNAFHSEGQIAMFDLFYQHWKDIENKIIVNINTMMRYHPNPMYAFNGATYNISKKKLHKTAMSNLFSDRKCRIINVSPGAVNTDINLQVMKNANIELPLLETQQVANVVKWVLDQPSDIEVTEISYRKYK
jgi:NADP-dependent 3-hydroxy acid dehydrogenase YdfG